VRLPIHKLFTPYASVAYGAQSFQLQTSNGAAAVIPSVAYKFLRLGLGTRVGLAPALSLEVGAAVLLVTDPGSKAGEIKSPAYFPHMTAQALDVGLSVGYRIIKLIGVRAGVDFRQYGLDFKVRQGEPLVVGGAKDRYITVGGGLEVLLDGMGGGAVAADDDDEKEPEAPPAPAKKKKKAGEESGEE
jgi:hypothetical protein